MNNRHMFTYLICYLYTHEYSLDGVYMYMQFLLHYLSTGTVM